MRINYRSTFKKNMVLWLLGALIAGLAAFIFIMSSQSGQVSQGLSRSIIRFFKENLGLADVIKDNKLFAQANFNILLRKLMHFTQFFVLAIIIYIFLVKTGFRKWKVPNTVLVISFILAAMDEFHQIFVRGRSALFSDVLVDFAGAALAVLLVHSFRTSREKSKASNL